MLMALLHWCSCCHVAVSVLCLFLLGAVGWSWYVIVGCPGPTHLVFKAYKDTINTTEVIPIKSPMHSLTKLHQLKFKEG